MNKGLYFVSLVLLIFVSVNANAYRIVVQVEGMPDQTFRLGYHSGPDVFMVDTARSDAQGVAVFEADKTLDHGVYFALLPSSAYVDFLVDEDQNFTIRTEAYHLIDSMTQEGSFQNEAFISFQKRMAEFNRRAKQLQVEKRFYERSNQDSLKNAAEGKIKTISGERRTYYDSLLSAFNGVLLGDIVRALIPVKAPPEIRSLQSSDPAQYTEWMNRHFFDNINFAEPGLFNTPDYIVHQKLQQYCRYFLDSRADSVDQVKQDVDRLINKSSASEKAHRYVLSFLLDYYDNPDAIGMEWVLVYLYDEWFAKNKFSWASQQFTDMLKTRAEQLRYTLVGKKAHHFRLPDRDNSFHENIAPDATYTILWFWDAACDVCIGHSKKLVEVYPQLQEKNAEVISVYTGSKRNAWQYASYKYDFPWIDLWNPHNGFELDTYYGLHKIPRLYVLDADGTILAKDISPDKLVRTLEYFETKNPALKQEFLFNSPKMKHE
jgi:peroxiredoxin